MLEVKEHNVENTTVVSDGHTAERDLAELKIELRSRMHRIYTSVFLIEHKLENKDNSYLVHDYIDTIQKELDCIRAKIIN